MYFQYALIPGDLFYYHDWHLHTSQDLKSCDTGHKAQGKEVKAKVKIIFQKVEDLHKACPKNLGDWYFTGNYPTPGGNRVVNTAFINFYEGNNKRAYQIIGYIYTLKHEIKV